MAELLDTPMGVGGIIDRKTNSFTGSNVRATTQTPSASTTPVISASALKTPQTPYDVQKPDTSVYSPLATAADSAVAKIQTSANTPENTAKDKLSGSLDQIIQGITGQAATEEQIRTDNGLYAKKQAATDAQNALDKLDREYQQKVVELKKNAEGYVGTGLQDKLNELSDSYHNTRANYALEYNVAANDYNNVQQIVNDKIASLDRQNSLKLAAYDRLVNLTYNDMTDSEKLKAQANYQAAQAENTARLDAYKTVVQNAANNGAPVSVLTAIDEASRAPGANAASIFAAAGSYGQDPQVRIAVAKAAQELSAGNVTISNPAASPYAGALQTILASGKFTKDQKASLIAGINSGDDPFTVIKNQAKSLLGQTEATTVTKYETAQSAMKDIQSQLKEFYAKGGSTNIFNGNYEKVINNLGAVHDPKLVDLATQIQASLQVYRNAVSGTAYSEQEGKDIASIFPGINKTEGLNTAIINGRLKAFDSTIDATYRTALGSTYDQLKQTDKQGVKGKLSSADFVEQTLKAKGLSYDTVTSQIPAGKKGVINNKTGQIGVIDPWEYDPSLYTSL